jgi:DNA-binding MltR family transcriptional regulator
MRKEPKPLSFDEFADELMREKQPRAFVILAAAKIDTQLRLLVDKFLLVKNSKAKEPDELLDGENPLSTFSARIKICHRLGLIDGTVADALNHLRNIRNQAAHWISFGVADAPLRDQCKHLKLLITSRQSYKLTVERFFFDIEMGEMEILKATLLTLSVLVETTHQRVENEMIGKVFKMPKLD